MAGLTMPERGASLSRLVSRRGAVEIRGEEVKMESLVQCMFLLFELFFGRLYIVSAI